MSTLGTSDTHPIEPASESPDRPPGGLRSRMASWPPVAGFSVASFVVIITITITISVADMVPATLLVAFTATMTIGALLNWIGSRVPLLKDFGLPVILCLIVPALLVYLDLMPESVGAMMSSFYSDLGLIDFVVVAVIVGSVAGLPRAMLMKILVRFLLPLAGTVLITFTLMSLVGMLFGQTWIETILFFVAPVMAGGLPMGALPMSEMYADQLGGQPEDYLSGLMSAVVLANSACIVIAAILNGIGKRVGQRFVGFNGEGQLLRVQGDPADLQVAGATTSSSYVDLAKGLMICGSVLLAALMLNAVAPVLHEYAWIVVLMAVVKIFDLFPSDWNDAANQWGDMVMSSFIPAFLVAISVAVIDIDAILGSIGEPKFVLLVLSTVVTTGIVSGVLGWLVRFNAIEAAITPGLIMADMGGSGDVAVLSAADRMELMPFAAVATRFGGALVLFLATLLVPLLTPR